MSLRVFHLVFIAASILMAAWVGGWSLQQYSATGRGQDLALGVVFFVFGLGLVFYGAYAVKKFRRMNG